MAVILPIWGKHKGINQSIVISLHLPRLVRCKIQFSKNESTYVLVIRLCICSVTALPSFGIYKVLLELWFTWRRRQIAVYDNPMKKKGIVDAS